MKHVVKVTGQQGRWWALVEYDDGTSERVPCAHKQYCGMGTHYHDRWDSQPGLMETAKFAEHREMF